MSFQYLSTYKINKNRKEQDSLGVNHFHLIFHQKIERASAFTSKGSITLEAALVIPVFFFAMLSLVFLLEMMSIRTNIQNALHSVGKTLSQQSYVTPMLSTPGLRQSIVDHVGEERIENSIIVNGTKGIDCSDSVSDWNTAIMVLSVKYEIEIPILMFHIPAIPCEETLRIKGWTGKNAGTEEGDRQEVVYITDHGTVYHHEMTCTYLDISIRGILADTIEDARNDSGGKYYACEICGGGTHYGILYVANYGDRYHTTLNCNTIQRNVYAVPYADVIGMGGCSKCVK